MWKSSLSIGRIAGTEVRLHSSCLLLLPYIIYLANSTAHVAPMLIALTLMCVLILASITLHELGHALVARRFNVPVRHIVLWPLGGFILFEQPIEEARHDLLISGAGPLVNLVLAGILWPLSSWAEGQLQVGLDAATGAQLAVIMDALILKGLLLLNASMGIFNLLPIYPLDGGKILRAALQLRAGEQRANLVTLVVSLPLALALIALGAHVGDPILIGMASLLLLAAATLSPRFGHALSLAVARLKAPGYFYKKDRR